MAITLEMPSGQSIVLESQSVTIGADRQCDVRLPGIQPRHAKIIKIAGKWMIESVGDWLLQVGDGVPGRKCWINPGDRIRLTESAPVIVFQPQAHDGGIFTPASAETSEPPPVSQPAAFPRVPQAIAKARPSQQPPSLDGTQNLASGFGAYLMQHFVATRWPAAFGVCCGMLAAPVISLLKPVLGLYGMVAILATVAGAGAVCGVVYLLARFFAYWLGGEKTVSDYVPSYAGAITYFCLTLLAPLVPLLIAECFTPPHGLLATIVPQFQKEQARWFSRSHVDLAGTIGSVGDRKNTDNVSNSEKHATLRSNTRVDKAANGGPVTASVDVGEHEDIHKGNTEKADGSKAPPAFLSASDTPQSELKTKMRDLYVEYGEPVEIWHNPIDPRIWVKFFQVYPGSRCGAYEIVMGTTQPDGSECVIYLSNPDFGGYIWEDDIKELKTRVMGHTLPR